MILKDQTIFILSLMRFDGAYESTNYTIARRLAEHNDVYYIDNPYTHRDYLVKMPRENWERRKECFSPKSSGILDTDLPRLKIIITPPVLSINFIPEGFIYRLLLKLNEKLIAGRVLKIIRERSIRDYIFINSFNFHYPGVAGLLNPKLYVYHCVDPLIADFDTRHGLISEADICKQADLIICTSKQLYKEKQELNDQVFFVPNAADLSHSSKALDPELPLNPIVATHKNRKLIGYFGNIERRMDFEMLDQLTTEMADCNFVFAGPYERQNLPEWLFRKPNVFLPGKVPYAEMPSVMKGFDVAIIPFAKDDVSRTIFPLKLFEYLGAGKPVVCTDFNTDLKEFTGEAVAYVSGAKAFGDAIEAALSGNNNEALLAERLRIAAENTWDARLEQINAIFYDALNRGHSLK